MYLLFIIILSPKSVTTGHRPLPNTKSLIEMYKHNPLLDISYLHAWQAGWRYNTS